MPSAPTHLPRIALKAGREHSVLRRHPWIFSGAVARSESTGPEGELVLVCDASGCVLGSGYTSDEGSIVVKMLSFDARPIDANFWRTAVAEAFASRHRLGLLTDPGTTACRVINAEGDGLPGLVCDRYNDTYVLQFQSAGAAAQEEAIVDALLAAAPRLPAGIFLKSKDARGGPDAERVGRYLHGAGGDPIVTERGLRFEVDWERGQKTGFFLDQRDNRTLLRSLAAGARVLNAFCYTGGFTLNALAGGAQSVVSVDTSARALELLDRNLALASFAGAHETVRDDVLQFVDRDARAFDIIVLDPPAFVKHRGALRGGLQGYRKVNRFGFARVEPGGLLFTFSCSQAVTPELFRDEVLAAAKDVGRPVQILHQLHQAPCHPVSLFHPEGEYLKGLVLRVGPLPP